MLGGAWSDKGFYSYINKILAYFYLFSHSQLVLLCAFCSALLRFGSARNVVGRIKNYLKHRGGSRQHLICGSTIQCKWRSGTRVTSWSSNIACTDENSVPGWTFRSTSIQLGASLALSQFYDFVPWQSVTVLTALKENMLPKHASKSFFLSDVHLFIDCLGFSTEMSTLVISVSRVYPDKHSVLWLCTWPRVWSVW